MRVGDRISSLRISSTLLERVENRQKDIKENPMTIIKRSVLPVLGRGKASLPTVTIGGKGQISFSPIASKGFDGKVTALVGWDSKSRTMSVQAFKGVPKGYTEADCFTLGSSKKSHVAYFSASALLQDADTGIGYDYKSSGNQTFPATVDEKTNSVSWKVPEGTMTPKPVTKREKKAKTPEVAKTAGAGVGAVLEEDN